MQRAADTHTPEAHAAPFRFPVAPTRFDRMLAAASALALHVLYVPTGAAVPTCPAAAARPDAPGDVAPQAGTHRPE